MASYYELSDKEEEVLFYEPVRVYRLQNDELYRFALEHTKNGNRLITVCSKNDAEFIIKGERPLYLKFSVYDDETIERIMRQASHWYIKCEKTEDWDPMFGYTQGIVKTESYHEIRIGQVLVQNGEFAGLLDYSEDFIGRFGLFYALVTDYTGEPLFFCLQESYGSSDKDMSRKEKYYLLKK